ncbi:MAG: hypothetical protein E7623_03465, partial [Ruminococcaceae bacterium]|nr:hypothetical protein [Oscillospiraceae bacterium]
YDEYEEQKYGIPRKGATGNAAAEGYRKVWREVSSRNPGLVFDACAGGGRRHDLETVRFSFEHTKSDWVEPVLSAQCQNFGAYSWYIFTGTGLCAPADNYDTRSRLTLSIGVPLSFCGDVGTYVKGLREWKSLHKYLYKDYYQISEQNYDEDGKMAMQFHDHEKEEGMMVAYLRKGGDYAFNAKALEADAEYKIWDGDKPETECVLTGKEIMNGGFKVSYEEGTPYASVVWYKKA